MTDVYYLKLANGLTLTARHDATHGVMFFVGDAPVDVATATLLVEMFVRGGTAPRGFRFDTGTLDADRFEE